MTAEQERKKRITAALTTLGVNALILLVMIFAAAWNTAGLGQGEYPGIEVNLGYDVQGSGNIQPMTPVGNENALDDEDPPPNPVEQPQEEIAPENATPDETIDKIIQPTTVTDPNSDVEIKEEIKEVTPAEKIVAKKPVEKVDKPVEKKPVEQPKIDTKAVYQGKSTSNPVTGGEGAGKQGTPGSEGNDVGKAGDKGVEGGIEGAAIYKGKPGGGDGSGLELYGWNWDYIPKPVTPDNELPGRIVYRIEVDENGELIKYQKESGTVSAAAERACVEALSKLTFTKESGANVPKVSRGKITFVIRSR